MQVAVVGAGRWGRLHAQKWAERGQLAAVVERRPERLAAAAVICPDAALLSDLRQLPEHVTAVTVAVDLAQLAGVTAALLRMGKHVLVEKPGAMTTKDALALHRLAAQMGVQLAVGFLERFNQALPQRSGRQLVAHRVGTPGSAAGPLAIDWLVHDLDLALFLLGPMSVSRARLRPDRAWVELEGAHGARARVLAATDVARPRRHLWLDGARCDLTLSGDALAAQFSAFEQAVMGHPAPSLARMTDALAVLRCLEAAHGERAAA